MSTEEDITDSTSVHVDKSCMSNTLWPMTSMCTGHGACVGESICECDEGWDGPWDMRWPGPNTDCNSYRPAIIGLWWVGFALFGLSLIQIAHVWHTNGFQTRKKSRVKTCIKYCCMDSIAGFIYHIYRLAFPDFSLGYDVIASLLFSIHVGLYWFQVYFYLGTFVDLAGEKTFKSIEEGSAKSIVRITVSKETKKKFLYMSQGCGQVAAWSVFASSLYSDPTWLRAMNTTHFVGSCLTLMTIGYVLVRDLGNVVKSIQDVVKNMDMSGHQNNERNVKMKNMLKQFKFMKEQALSQCLQNMLVTFLFAFWPFLQRQTVYDFAFADGFVFAFLNLVEVYTLSNTEKSRSKVGDDRSGRSTNSGSGNSGSSDARIKTTKVESSAAERSVKESSMMMESSVVETGSGSTEEEKGVGDGPGEDGAFRVVG